jgi:hypothetical protein
MAEGRGITYEIGVETGEAQGNLDRLEATINELDESTARVQVGAQNVSGALSGMGTSGVGAARQVSDAAADMGRSFNEAGDNASAAFSDVGAAGVSAAQDVSAAASDIGDSFDRAGNEASAAMSDVGAAGSRAARDVSDAANEMGDAFDEAGDEARAAFKRMGEESDSFGAAFKKTMAAGLRDGQSLAKSFSTGVSGAIAFTGKKFTGFKNDVSKGAKAIGTAFLHPIQTIKGKFIQALEKAEDAEADVGDQAEKTEKDIKDLGDAGEKGGNQIADAMKGALAAFVSFEAIKAGAEAIKNFVGSALEAAGAVEQVGAKFDRVFAGTQTEEWAENYSDAVNRSANEVKGFLVQNKGMYTELGITGEAADELSKITTSLAYDFGNAFKMEDAEALSVMQEGIRGNAAALAEYGIDIGEAAIKQQALKVGLSDQIDELDEATLAQLRMNAILEQSGDIQQAAINQTGGLVNSTKSLKGIWQGFMEDAGGKFTPVIEKLFGTIIEAWPQIEPALMGLVDLLTNGLSEAVPRMYTEPCKWK